MPNSPVAYPLVLGLLVALIGLTRLDLLLIAGPIGLAALASSARRPRRSAFGIRHSACAEGSGETRRSVPRRRLAFGIRHLAFLAGALPLLGWTLFSVAYYGVPFPNTAYAKLATGVPQEMLTTQGFRYLGESFDRDPLTLPLIAAAILAPVVVALLRLLRRAAPAPLGPWAPEPLSPTLSLSLSLSVSLALLLYLAYIVRVGGDFMSGRFLAAPFVVAVFALVGLPWPRRALPGLALVLFVAGVGLTAREPSVALLVGESRQEFHEMWLPHGVVDERSFYFDRTAFLTRDGVRTGPRPDEIHELVAALREQHPRTVVFQTVGKAGYYVGSDRHIIDTLALCDPLLARLPAIPPWRIGHYQRPLPEGYFESVDTDSNRIADPGIAALYEDIRLATRAPLWTLERWRAIWRLNTGRT
jgi:arabinofuranosyltransferase